MSSWSSRRKRSIAFSILIIIAAILAAIYFLFFYKAPTCFDGIQNGGEVGIDCGGKCQKLCQSAFVPPKIVWGGGKFEKITPNLYNIAALIENLNINVAAINVPYKFSLYDARGLLIVEKTGVTNIPAHRNILVFVPAVNVGQRTPVKVIFEFTGAPVWFKSHDTLGSLAVADRKYTEGENSSSLEINFLNKSLIPISNITVGAVLYDIAGNTIGFSQTKIDKLAPESQQIAPFTWPLTRNDAVVTIEAYPVVAPIRD